MNIYAWPHACICENIMWSNLKEFHFASVLFIAFNRACTSQTPAFHPSIRNGVCVAHLFYAAWASEVERECFTYILWQYWISNTPNKPSAGDKSIEMESGFSHQRDSSFVLFSTSKTTVPNASGREKIKTLIPTQAHCDSIRLGTVGCTDLCCLD